MSKSLEYGILVASTYLPKQKLEESAHFGIQKKQLSSTSAYNCPIHNFKIANNQQRFSLHVDKVHYKYTAVNSSFCKQAFLISPALPTPPLVWGMEASKESLSLAVSSAVRDRCKAKRQKPKAMFSQLVPAGDSNVSLFAGDKPEFLPTERQDTWRGTWWSITAQYRCVQLDTNGQQGYHCREVSREVPGEVPVEVPALSLVVWYWVVAGWKPPLDSAGAAQTLAPTSPHSSLQQPAGPSSSQMWPKRAKVAEMGQKLSSVAKEWLVDTQWLPLNEADSPLNRLVPLLQMSRG